MKAIFILFSLVVVANALAAEVFEAQASAATPRRVDCRSALDEIQGNLSMAQKAKSEIVDLILEKSELANTGDSALLSLVEKNIKAKIAEYESRSGHRIDENEIRNLVRLRETGRNHQTVEKQDREGSARQRERQKGVGWTLAPVMLQENFLTESHRCRMTDVAFAPTESGGLRVIYQASVWESAKPGYHVYDFGSRQDFYFGKTVSAVASYDSNQEDLFVGISSAVMLSEPASLTVSDITAGQSRSFDLKTGWPLAKKLMGRFSGYPYRKADGSVGVIIKEVRIPESSHNLTRPAVYDINPQTGKVHSLGKIEPFSHISRSPDGRHVYSVGVAPAGGLGSRNLEFKLVVRDLAESRVLYDETVKLETALSFRQEAGDVRVSSIVSTDGHVHIAINTHGTKKIMIRDLMTAKTQEFERQEFAFGGGVFVEGSDQELYFLPAPEESGGVQRILNLNSGEVDEKHIGEFANVKLVKTVGGHGVGPFAFYTARTRGALDSVLISLPLSRGSLDASTLRFSDIHASELGDVTVASDGRVVAAFMNDGDSRSDKLNMHLIQLFGPAGATK